MAASAGLKRSRTAQGVLAERTILDGMGVIDDPFAPRLLDTPWRLFVAMIRHWPTPSPPWSVARAGLATRTLWIDEQLTRSLQAGVRQVAIIGAGYDTRAWRFRRPGVAFYELDRAGTQRDKRRRAPTPGPTYVEADLQDDDAAAALIRHGLDPTRTVHLILEGVTMYLDEATLGPQLTALATAGAPGSRLSVEFHPPAEAGTGQDRRLMKAQRAARVGSGETLRFLADRDTAAALLARSGWVVEELRSMRDAAHELVPERFGLPVERINAHKTLVLASNAGHGTPA